jgi:hypothetical protein
MTGEDMQGCRCCGQDKPVTDYYITAPNKPGKQWRRKICKQCQLDRETRRLTGRLFRDWDETDQTNWEDDWHAVDQCLAAYQSRMPPDQAQHIGNARIMLKLVTYELEAIKHEAHRKQQAHWSSTG